MATRIFTTSLTTVGNNITLMNSEVLFVAPFAVRASSEGLGIRAVFPGHAITILGTIYGDTGGILFGPSRFSDTNGSIFLGAGGAVTSRLDGIESRGRLVNMDIAGEVKGSTGIRHVGDFLELNVSGRVIGTGISGSALSVTGSNPRITNSGEISATAGSAITIDRTSSSTSIDNLGLIAGSTRGGTRAIDASDNADNVVNHGTIRGSVILNGSDDVYDGREGSIIAGRIFGDAGRDILLGGRGHEFLHGGTGDDQIDGGAGDDQLFGEDGDDTIDGGDGNDTIVPGAGLDVLDGGAGRDLLNYVRFRDDVSVNLITGEAGGAAAGDDFTGFEDLAGGSGNDILVGDTLANRLFGGHGNDMLMGAAGNDVLVGNDDADTLVGGAGVDVLRGGLGADIFRFTAPGDSGVAGGPRDRIVDFSQAEGDRIDLSFIDANATLAGNQAFVLVQTGFSAAGQVRTQQIGGNTFVFANTDANPATAEFSILLFGTHALVAADFIL